MKGCVTWIISNYLFTKYIYTLYYKYYVIYIYIYGRMYSRCCPNINIPQLGTLGTLSCSQSAHNILLKDLDPFPQHEISLIGIYPSLQPYNLIFSIKLIPTMVVLKHSMVGALFSTLKPPLALQNQHKKTNPKVNSNFLFFSSKLESHISQKVVVLNPCCHKLGKLTFPTYHSYITLITL
jgi:hypothetical protein